MPKEGGGGGGGTPKPGGGGGSPKPEGGGGGGGAGGGERPGRELGGEEAMGGAGGGWVGLITLVRFCAGAPYCPSLYLQVKHRHVKLESRFTSAAQTHPEPTAPALTAQHICTATRAAAPSPQGES